jgi:hypothetical protein
MSFCTACGTKNPADARFCSACGHALVVAPVAEPVPPVASVSPVTPPPSAAQSAAVTPVRLKAFDNPDELWKMYFYVSFFNIGAYFLTNSASSFLEESGGFLSIPMGIFTLFMVAFLGLAYWLIKNQAVDKGRTLWLLPLIAWQVYAYLDGLSGFDPMYAESSFDYYDAYISGVPETLILIRLFVALRERIGGR